MRLSKQQADMITVEAKDIFGPNARVKLFGSRMDDNKRGGDIDLLVELPHPVMQPVLASARLEARLMQVLGLQKIDVIVSAPNIASTPIHAVAAQGIVL
ncbi:nucleotidyltransferase domain-containing protein [Rheinheimera sp. YQF-2]|jgi:predicted nucleotidyltransferase|uniref:Nucleotidyltransferase domain-containing protein n=1 Tax=Rheinheimera lutimaris TaxID=2740584 RepID=A0A7Y5ARN8_9GAMM|nr:nucleotidyltransferase domain-containing protein [Rheinheimera lutimaris]NRQ43248.1 nucleotidyltransferase domain-containing protein [Rheinheimera lutimaris]